MVPLLWLVEYSFIPPPPGPSLRGAFFMPAAGQLIFFIRNYDLYQQTS